MMAWLTSPLLFYGSLPFLLAAPFVLLVFTARDRKTGKTFKEQFRDAWRPSFAFSDMKGMLRRLLKSGYDRAHLVITFTESGYFLQYRKYIHAKGDYGIELSFPISDWSRSFVPSLREYCDANGIAHSEGTEAPGDPMTFIHVDFSKDAAAAFAMAKAIVAEVFAIPTDSTYTWEFDGLHPYGELIDNPRSKPPSESETWRRMNEDAFTSTGMYLTDTGWYLLRFICGYAGVVGLLHALIWKSLWATTTGMPGWGSVTLELFYLSFAARNFDLACFGLIATVLAIGFTPAGRRLKAVDRKSDNDDVILPGWLLVIGRMFPRRLLFPAILAATVAFWFV